MNDMSSEQGGNRPSPQQPKEFTPATAGGLPLSPTPESPENPNILFAVRGQPGRGGRIGTGVPGAPGQGAGRGEGAPNPSRRNFLLGALATAGLAAATAVGVRFATQGYNPVEGPDVDPKPTGVVGGGTGASPTVRSTETPAPSPTPEKTPDPNKIFMKDAIRTKIGDTTLAVDKDYPSRTECPDPKSVFGKTACKPVNMLVKNESDTLKEALANRGDGATPETLIKEGNEKMFALAWARDTKGMKLQDIISNYDAILQEYKELTTKGIVKFSVLAFSDKDNYVGGTVVEMDSSYKVEYDFIPQPNKYTPIERSAGYNMGYVVNTDARILHVVGYSWDGGGIGTTSGYGGSSGNPSLFGAAVSLAWGATVLGDKELNANGKMSNNSYLPLVVKLHESFVPYKTPTDWEGIVVAR